MARTQNLRHKVINQFIDAIRHQYICSPLPSQSVLAEMYNVSRTTVRHVLTYLTRQKILENIGNDYVIIRKPNDEDLLDTIVDLPDIQLNEFESFFYKLIQQKELKPGDNFTELQLAHRANVSPVVVREFLLQFSQYNLIENLRRGLWSLKTFEQDHAEKLFELRELLETYALTRFMNLPANDKRWVQAKELLFQHRELRETIVDNYRAFSDLDRKFHTLLLSAAENPFFDQSLNMVTIIFHFHYQWDDSDLRERNALAIEEHMTILSAIVSHNDLQAMNELRNHLYTAKQSMKRSLQTSIAQPSK
ncbi:MULTISPECIES: GntR family transcriptional regulator [unclassified Providencia]|uniref:GntR family transcriptional regulator n=1 Tax=unclassified Providencia TaxID=2633465 RepID=UPI000E8AAB3F|nr:GntR family transcriptional regulator [Providencia sp.]MBP6079830.1 GntR family transcriptional regulator [Providencia sp.]HBO23628.1 GntR family transcriptional regulator [Providencia sp.]